MNYQNHKYPKKNKNIGEHLFFQLTSRHSAFEKGIEAPNKAKITQDAVMIQQKLREHCTDNLGFFVHIFGHYQKIRIMNIYTLPTVIHVYLQELR